MVAEMAVQFKSHRWEDPKLLWVSRSTRTGWVAIYQCKRCKAAFHVDRQYADKQLAAPRKSWIEAGIRANCNEMIVANIMGQ